MGHERRQRQGPARAEHPGRARRAPACRAGRAAAPGPVLAAPYHLRGAKDAAPYGYGRDENPTWTHLERALGELDGGESVVFASGMAAVTAVIVPRLRPGQVLVACGDGYPGIRRIAADDLEPNGIEVRMVPTDTDAILAAVDGAALVWVETPSNPKLDVCDVDAVVAAAHGAGALVAVDNTVATPLGFRPLDHGADFAMVSGTKSLSGHSDVVLGAVSVRDPVLADELRDWRSRTGSVLGPFEAWLAHRSLATLGLRLERSLANARALAEALAGRDDVTGVRWPGVGAVLALTLPSAERAQAFLDACELVSEATSFGGVHSTAERRGRWGTDDVPDGFIRFAWGARTPRTSSRTCSRRSRKRLRTEKGPPRGGPFFSWG